MRSVRGWLQSLNQTSEVIRSLAGQGNPVSEDTCVVYGPTVNELASRIHPRYSKLVSDLTITTSSPETVSRVLLSNGVQMPSVGLGTWQLQGDECRQAVETAISLGYRHIDTAQAYNNEIEVGIAISNSIRNGTVTRKDLFIATKMSSMNDYNNAIKLVKSQLKNLQIDYIDLYMLHVYIPDPTLLKESWRALEDLVKQGKIKSLGVSNFDNNQLATFHKNVKIKPVVLQNKFDIFHFGKQIDTKGINMEDLCKSLGIRIVAWSSLNGHPFVMMPTDDPIVKYVAVKMNCTPAQVILRWALQRGAAVIPRSTNAQRLAENLAVTNMSPLSPEDFALVSSISHLISSSIHVSSV